MLKLLYFSGIPPYGSVRLWVNYCAAVEHVGWRCLKANVVTIQSSGSCSPWVNICSLIYSAKNLPGDLLPLYNRDRVHKPQGRKCVLYYSLFTVRRWQWNGSEKWQRCLAWKLSSKILISFHSKAQPHTDPRQVFHFSRNLDFTADFSKKRFSWIHFCFISLFYLSFPFSPISSLWPHHIKTVIHSIKYAKTSGLSHGSMGPAHPHTCM